ncbi:unnamed protein product, partial [Cuscuta epithymum]
MLNEDVQPHVFAGSSEDEPEFVNDDGYEYNPSSSEFDDQYLDGEDDGSHLDDYQSGDDSDYESDDNTKEVACNRYETGSGGFEFNATRDNIILKPGQLFVNVNEFRKVLQIFAIRNGFRLKRLKNEKSRVTAKCAADGCTWRINASPNWNKRTFQVKTYCFEHTCARIDDNYEANSIW